MNILETLKFELEIKNIEIVSNFYIYIDDLFIESLNLTSLYGSPRIVKGSFSCSYNKLKTLKYCPSKVYKCFYCYNNNLTSLKYCLVEIPWHFHCGSNLLTSLDYCPKFVGGNFYCHGNKVQFTEEYIKSICEVKGQIIC